MKKQATQLIVQLAKLVWALFKIVFGLVLNGYVLMKLYNWFIVPPTHAPAINHWQAIGLWFIVLFVRQRKKKTNFFLSVVKAFLFLAVGALIQFLETIYLFNHQIN